MTTSETLYRAEELFHEELKRKTNWGRNELIVMFQMCIRQALGESLDAIEYTGGDKPDIKPKGYGGVVLHGIQDDPHDPHDPNDTDKPDGITRIYFNDDDNPF